MLAKLVECKETSQKERNTLWKGTDKTVYCVLVFQSVFHSVFVVYNQLHASSSIGRVT